MLSVRRALLAATAVALAALPLRAQSSLSGVINGDNVFTAFLASASSPAMVQVASGNEWWRTVAFSGVQLQAGENYRLRIRVDDQGTIAALLATLTITGDSHRFATGGTTLVTGLGGGWTGATSDWETGVQSLVAYGARGNAIWGNTPQGHTPLEWGMQASSAQWVWTADNCVHCTRYFTADIVAVPEPATAFLLAGGLLLLPLARRRRA